MKLPFYTFGFFLVGGVLVSLLWVTEGFGIISGDGTNSGCSLELTDLMTELSRERERKVQFREEKFLSNLETPLKAEGILYFKAPDHLEKIIKKPQKEHLVVHQNRVSISDEDQQNIRTFSLDRYPPLKELVNAIRYTLGGNLKALTTHYELTFKGSCNFWHLIMIPKFSAATEIVKRIDFFGTNNQISRMKWLEPNGDYTILYLLNDEP